MPPDHRFLFEAAHMGAFLYSCSASSSELTAIARKSRPKKCNTKQKDGRKSVMRNKKSAEKM